MVWGGISWNHKSALVVMDGTLTRQRYIDEILRPVAIPFGKASIGNGFLFQDDNAHPHRANVVKDFHEQSLDYSVMGYWPPKSPDFNPIEHLWDVLGRQVSRQQPQNIDHLCDLLNMEWGSIGQD